MKGWCNMENTIYTTKHMYVNKFVHSGLIRYWVGYRDHIGSYGCYKDKDYAIEVCDYIENTENWDD